MMNRIMERMPNLRVQTDTRLRVRLTRNTLAPPTALPMRRCPYRVPVPVGSAYGCANQAIGRRCHLLA